VRQPAAMRSQHRRPVPILVASAAAALLLFVACGSGSDSGSDSGESGGDSDSAPTQVDLEGTTFTTTSMTGSGLVQDSTITLSFEDGSMALQAGCNTHTAPYEVDDGRLKWSSPPAGTLKACSPDLEAQDAVLTELFTSGAAATLDSTTLTLTNDDEDLTLVLDAT
jgi:heat shock protein HslJ